MSENSKYQKELIKCVEDKAVSNILKEKFAGAGPAAARDSYREKIESLHAIGSNISKDSLYKRVSRLWKATIGKLPVLGKIQQPLSCAKGVALMNDLIKDTPMQDALK